MLYILPPPSNPSPPSPWPNILCNKQKAGSSEDANIGEKVQPQNNQPKMTTIVDKRNNNINNNINSNRNNNDGFTTGKLVYKQFVKKRSTHGASVIQRWLNSVQQNSLEKNKKYTSSSYSGFKNSGGPLFSVS